MKPGDKVVCINSGNFITFNGLYKKSVFGIKENIIYKVRDTGPSYDLLLYDIPGIYYHSERFITLEEYRRIKLNKINERIN